MLKLAAMIYVIVAPTMMGIFVAVLLIADVLSSGLGITLAAILGAIGALPASWQVAKAISGRQTV